MRAFALVALAGVAAGLGACALVPPIEPGVTTEAQILATYGKPTRHWDEADGATTLEFATQPAGVSCFMVTVDSSQRVLNVRDALSDTNLARVQIGMSEEEVDRLLGRHSSESFFPLSGETVWDWNIPNFGPGIYMHFNVRFKGGRVVGANRDPIYGDFMDGGGVIFRPPAYLPCPRCVP